MEHGTEHGKRVKGWLEGRQVGAGVESMGTGSQLCGERQGEPQAREREEETLKQCFQI